jgi:hypothetical protein
MALRPPLKFVQFYFGRLGILDGTPGLMWCGIVAYYNLSKYAKLWELHNSRTKSAQRTETNHDNLATPPAIRRAA